MTFSMYRWINSRNITKVVYDVNMSLMHEDEVSHIWVSSLITWCNPNWGVIFSIAVPSKILAVHCFLQKALLLMFDWVLNTPLSWEFHILNLTLKSLMLKMFLAILETSVFQGLWKKVVYGLYINTRVSEVSLWAILRSFDLMSPPWFSNQITTLIQGKIWHLIVFVKIVLTLNWNVIWSSYKKLSTSIWAF